MPRLQIIQAAKVVPNLGTSYSLAGSPMTTVPKRVARRDSELHDGPGPADSQFRLLVDAVQDYAIFLLDPEGYVCSWNLGAERITQYNASEIIGSHLSRFYLDEDKRKGKPQAELLTAAKDGRFEDEDWRLRKDGSSFWASVILSAIRDAEGRLVGFAKVTRDATEKMKAQLLLQKEVEERREAQQRLHLSENSLRQLSLHLLRTQDEERKRIGRDLHDSLGQYLAILKLKLDSLVALCEEKSSAAAQDLQKCISLAESCIKEVRTVSYLLYPPMLEELGLKSAVPWYLDGFAERSGIKLSFHVQPGFGRPSRDAELALFRVLQESLTNVHRHSETDTAAVRLMVENGMCILEVEDHGKGMPFESLEQSGQPLVSLGVGLRGMDERVRHLGGKLEVITKKGSTIVRATVPAANSTSIA